MQINFKNCMGIFTTSIPVIFYLHNINHASWEETTSSCILFLPKNETVICNFSIIVSHATVETWYLFHKAFCGIFFLTCTSQKYSIISLHEHSVYKFSLTQVPSSRKLIVFPACCQFLNLSECTNITASISGLHWSSSISASLIVLITLALGGAG
jgi:hypothetical protein